MFSRNPPSDQLQISVIIPARNEAHHITSTLDALRHQQDADGQPLNPAIYEVLLLANNCTDQTYDVALRYQQQHPDFSLHIAQIKLPAPQANIGTVRRMLMDDAHRRLMSIGKPEGIIASTDGDTVVDTYWLHHIMREIANGNDAVGGRILTHRDASNVRLYHLRDVMYRTLVAKAEALLDPSAHDPWPRHFQHFGASVAVTCQTYERVGGLPPKPYLEDEAFYWALFRADAKVRHSPNVKVITSARQQGRVEVGFSQQLRYWADMSQSKTSCQLAEPAEAVMIRLHNRQRLRSIWLSRFASSSTSSLASVASALQLDADWLRQEVGQALFFGDLWEKVKHRMETSGWAQHWQPVPITQAIQDLRVQLSTSPSYCF
ncbi:glycosyltransferase family 2 protein [Spirosoma fluminis]